MPPLGLWMPYPVYRDRHLAHHRTRDLTAPGDDTESFYIEAARWRRFGPVLQAIYRFNQTLLGRMLVGPALAAIAYWGFGGRKASRRRARFATRLAHPPRPGDGGWGVDRRGVRDPAMDLQSSCSRTRACRSPWCAHTSSTVRRSKRSIAPRSSKAGRWRGLLYLNNNLHFLHHARPDLPWFALPAAYRRERDSLVVRNGGYRFSGYAEVARRYFVRAKDSPIAGCRRRALYGIAVRP